MSTNTAELAAGLRIGENLMRTGFWTIGRKIARNVALAVVAGIGLMLLFGYAFSWVFAFVGLVSSSPESSQAFGFIVVFPLTFVSSAFVPVDSMPMALQTFAEVNPITITVDAMRALWLGAPAGDNVWQAALWAIGIATVFAALSVNRYIRAVIR